MLQPKRERVSRVCSRHQRRTCGRRRIPLWHPQTTTHTPSRQLRVHFDPQRSTLNPKWYPKKLSKNVNSDSWRADTRSRQNTWRTRVLPFRNYSLDVPLTRFPFTEQEKTFLEKVKDVKAKGSPANVPRRIAIFALDISEEMVVCRTGRSAPHSDTRDMDELLWECRALFGIR